MESWGKENPEPKGLQNANAFNSQPDKSLCEGGGWGHVFLVFLSVTE